MKFKKCLYKVLFVMILLFILLGFKNVFGYEQTYNDKTFTIPDELIEHVKTLEEYGNDDYYIVYSKEYWNQNLYAVAFVPKNIKIYYYHNDSHGSNRATLLYSSDSGYDGIVFYNFKIDTLEQTHKSLNRYNEFSYMDFYITDDGKYCVYSDETIYSSLTGTNEIDENTIFFPSTPLQLAPIVEKKAGEMKTTQKEIILLLPMILAVVVSFLGLHKALRMLSTVLHRS